MEASDIQVINTVVPQGSDKDYIINFTLNSEGIGISSARISFSKEDIADITEAEKPQLILNKLKSIFSDNKVPDTPKNVKADNNGKITAK